MLLPRRKMSWDTRKDPRTVMNTVRSMTEPTMKPWKKESPRLFYGSVSEDRFELGLYQEPMTRGYASGIQITGGVSPAEHGARISLRMLLNPLGRSFMLFWFAGVAVFFCISLLILLHDASFGLRGAGISLLLFLGGQAMIRIRFKRQADRAERVFREVFPS